MYTLLDKMVEEDVSPWMETFGCSFLVHSGRNRVSADGAGDIGSPVFWVMAVGRRRSRRTPAIDKRLESCEDAVMVMTSPLNAKVGLWDTAEGEEGQTKRRTSAPQCCLSVCLPSIRERSSL